MLDTVLGFFAGSDCGRDPGHDSLERSRHRSLVLEPFWDAIEFKTPELESRAQVWFEANGATALEDVFDFDLTEQFLDFLKLKPVQKLKASRFLGDYAESQRIKPFCQKEECQVEMKLRQFDRVGSQTRGTSSILRQRRRSARSASTYMHVSFAADTKGGQGQPGDTSPPASAARPRFPKKGSRSRRLKPCTAPCSVPPARTAEPPAKSPGQVVSSSSLVDQVLANTATRNVAHFAGQAVEVYSRSRGCWVGARVVDVFPDGAIDVVYRDLPYQKHIPSDLQFALVRPVHASQPSTPLVVLASPGSHGNVRSPYVDGQSVFVYSQARGTWLDAQVIGLLPDATVIVQCTSVGAIMVLGPREQQVLMRAQDGFGFGQV